MTHEMHTSYVKEIRKDNSYNKGGKASGLPAIQLRMSWSERPGITHFSHKIMSLAT